MSLLSKPPRGRRFRIFKSPLTGRWHWVCMFCFPYSYGSRETWGNVIHVALLHHFRTHVDHHQWVQRTQGDPIA
jgi:hypothetical protein